MRTTILVAIAALACVAVVHANIVSVDVGSDSMKIALVKPGLPFHVVSNLQSKRKTPPAITFHDGERFFGADALGLQARKPEYTFVGVHRLLGRNSTHQLAGEFFDEDQYVGHGASVNSRGGYDVYFPDPTANDEDAQTKTFKVPSKYSVEEVTAMILAHGREFSEAVAEGKIKDAVITVPAFYTQNERLALVDAAELAGLNVLALVDENFAAGVRYSIDNVYNETTNVLIYNMGAGHTQVSINAHSSYTVKEGATNKTYSQFKVVGKGWSYDVSGGHFDSVLIEKFADAFNAGGYLKNSKEGSDVRKIPRAMAKLKKNVQKIKEILSVNDEYPVVIESLAADKDFKMAVKRTDLELWAAPLLALITAPIDQALKDANLTKADIHAVEVIGGGVRMPKVQAVLAEYFGALSVGQHLNGDEAVALGAAFVAANRSSAYRVKKIGAIDISPFSVTVNISSNSEDAVLVEPPTPEASADPAAPAAAAAEGEDEEASEEVPSASSKVWAKHSQIFPEHSQLGTTKKIAFRHPHDINAVLFHDVGGSERLPAGSPKVLARYNITGVEDVVKGPKGHLGTPKIVLAFTLDHSGIYGLKSAEAQLEEVLEVPVPTPKPSPTPKPTKAPKKAAKKNATEPVNGTADEGADTVTPTVAPSVGEATDAPVVNATEGAAVNATAPKTMMKKFIRKFPLKVAVDTSELNVQPLSAGEKAASKRMLKRMQQVDDERRAREAAKNAVEAFVFSSRDKLYSEATDLEKVSTEEQREALSTALTAAEDWLYDEGESATLAVYKAKLAELKAVADVIFVPLQQYQNPTPVPTPPPANSTAPANGTQTETGSKDGDSAGASEADAEDGEAAPEAGSEEAEAGAEDGASDGASDGADTQEEKEKDEL